MSRLLKYVNIPKKMHTSFIRLSRKALTRIGLQWQKVRISWFLYDVTKKCHDKFVDFSESHQRYLSLWFVTFDARCKNYFLFSLICKFVLRMMQRFKFSKLKFNFLNQEVQKVEFHFFPMLRFALSGSFRASDMRFASRDSDIHSAIWCRSRVDLWTKYSRWKCEHVYYLHRIIALAVMQNRP